MSNLSTVYSQTLAEIEAEIEEKRDRASVALVQAKQELIDLFEQYRFSPNAILDFDKMLLNNENDYSLPCALRIGDLLPKPHNPAQELLIPAILPFSNINATAFMIDNEKNNEEDIQQIFQMMAFRIMLSLPINLCKFHFVDTHSFGKKYNVMNRLSDKITANAIVYDEKKLDELIKELGQAVADLNQMQLTKYPSLEAYNKDAGILAVPYRFLFISNFPHGFSKEMADRFFKLIYEQNAAKAGIFIFYSIDNTISVPHGFDISSFMNNSALIYSDIDKYYEISNSSFDKSFYDAFYFKPHTTLPTNLDTLIEAINRRAANVKQPIISMDPYLENLIKTNRYWKESSRLGIKIPIGKHSIDETLFFEFAGDTTDYFAMVGGRPGYGKTVLLHNIISNGSIIYSPQELNYYLIDCTNGTGFKPYDKLPHATFVSITNQREYTVSALEHLINEMYRRADLFKYYGEQSGTTIEKIEEYRKKTGDILPRLLVIIDEFQVLLENGDKISRKASFYLEKIIREGRKYGMHIIFCTQSYRNLDFNTDLITLRIAFNLKEYDSVKVLGGNNEEATKLTKKGEGILNNKNGNIRDNIKFQGAYTDKMLDYVSFCVSKMDELQDYSAQRFVFDGSIDSNLATNAHLKSMISTEIQEHKPMQPAKIYVGVPSFIRNEHIYFRIRNNHCSNLLMIGGDLEAAMSCLMLANYQLSKQSSAFARFFIVDFLGKDDQRSNYYPQICNLTNNVQYCEKRELPELIDSIEQELNQRIENDNNGISNADRGRIVLTLSYIQNAKDLKKDGYRVSPTTEKIVKILKNGPDLGIHIMAYSYTCKGLEEVFERMVWNEFENVIVLSEGGGMAALTEQTAEPKGKGYGLLQTDEETATYNPDPFLFYNRFDAQSDYDEKDIFEKIFEIFNYNQ